MLGGTPTSSSSANPIINADKKKILIVEDEMPLADALEIKFTQAGFQVFKAVNGQEGLNAISNNKPDVILLDLMMPVMDGKTMLSKLRAMPGGKEIPVLVLTNAGDIESMNETKTYYNAIDFLIKSNVNPDDVVEKVKSVVV